MIRHNTTIAKIHAELHKTYPHVNIYRGKGYYYISSDDNEWALKIATLFSSSLFSGCVPYLYIYSVEDWVTEVKRLISEIEKPTITCH